MTAFSSDAEKMLWVKAEIYGAASENKTLIKIRSTKHEIRNKFE
jgi:hypothetical protein